jgi:EpsI family protein
MMVRAVVLTGCLIATALYLSHAARAEATPIRQPLAAMPLTIDEWRGRLEPEFSPEILEILRVDDYTVRSYRRSSGVVGLYVGYHATQRQGASIHSPLNCLPGAGWIPIEQGRLTLTVNGTPGGPARTIEVNRVLIAKGIDRQLVLYWYQSHGRIVASEYWGKAYSVYDAIRLNRTDAALVRITAPVLEGRPEGVPAAEREAVAFVQDAFPLLTEYLPS